MHGISNNFWMRATCICTIVIKWQVYIKNLSRFEIFRSLNYEHYIFFIFRPAILNSHSLFNHSRNVTSVDAVQARRITQAVPTYACRHIACSSTLFMLNTRKLWSPRPHCVAPEVVAPRHAGAWNVREVACPCTNELAIPSHLVPWM